MLNEGHARRVSRAAAAGLVGLWIGVFVGQVALRGKG